MIVLGIETSCDDTSIAIVKNGTEVYSSVVSSQVKIHAPHGGTVPELGARKHVENIVEVYKKALDIAGILPDDIDRIAVTNTPGLKPALNVGVAFALGLSKQLKKEIVYVNHVFAHGYSLMLHEEGHTIPSYPIILLIVSGGHTQLVIAESPLKHKIIGETIDDAAGECFDKVARMLNLPYPGGPVIDKISIQGDETAIKFPRPLIKEDNYNFSFSGLKTAVKYYIRDKKLQPTIEETNEYEEEVARFHTIDIASSFQEAVVDVLVEKTIKLAKEKAIPRIGVVGGVSANSRLRQKMMQSGAEQEIGVFFPPMKYCTDNAAMVAGIGNFI
ncbi:MAG TPA: tRNA (adenosine(37)-N6)-threonylcarbamoyltransferase complex transferase subunit TsaD [Candidatus Dojkabacteria bacterium]|nr:tRNA (adenosine(37)-N6)-threonylcarbamoyltransferase complex transferase subunit TsaD [Candidatus Dojkabacteria bacterium]HQF36389.1 tRNA (adenosine(37)-N6)-threonylcarbamoyltransferase complex transferase subunit TsaD [Candidatus Dojkabacteria bacterium]